MKEFCYCRRSETMLDKESSSGSGSGQNDTLYLCNFRVSVDGDWLCLKEVDGDTSSSAASTASEGARQRRPPDSLAITPELDRLEKIYPNYPVGNRNFRP